MERRDSSPLQAYIPLVEFLGKTMGEHCEVVLHDVRNIESSIVAIENNHISNRNVGGSLTDLALKILKNQQYLKTEYILNYSGMTKEGKVVQSSTFFIRDSQNSIIGMLCFNKDISKIVEARDVLDSLIAGGMEPNESDKQPNEQNLEQNESATTEKLHTSIEDLTTSIILKTLAEVGVVANRMSSEEKIGIVQKLNDQGVFLIKGSVPEVAQHLKISEATVYRYLNKMEVRLPLHQAKEALL